MLDQVCRIRCARSDVLSNVLDLTVDMERRIRRDESGVLSSVLNQVCHPDVLD